MRKMRPNPLVSHKPDEIFIRSAYGSWLVVFWLSKIGYTADGFTFYNSVDMVERALKDQGSRVSFDHGFNLKLPRQLATPTGAVPYYACECGCGLAAVKAGADDYLLLPTINAFEPLAGSGSQAQI